jgi:diguanylate cyclase (GGDEF)-like protein
MEPEKEKLRLPTNDFRVATNLGVALVGLVLLTPFAINNFLQHRYLLGAGSLAIVVLLAVNAWTTIRGRYHVSLIFAGIVPAILFFLVLAFRDQGVIGALWCYPAVISFYFMLPERSAWLANGALLAVAVPQAWAVLEHPLAVRVAVTLLAVSTFSAVFVRVITVQQRKLHDHAVTDPLTGLSNRILLDSMLEQAVQQHRRAGIPMTLVALDLDHFKSINDTLGHDTGDTVLRGIGALLRGRIRRSDRVFRLGGEEFLLLLHDTDAEHARRLAEDLRYAVESLPLLPDRPVTASLGLATLETDEDWRDWMRRADESLYRAKAAGRNRVET